MQLPGAELSLEFRFLIPILGVQQVGYWVIPLHFDRGLQEIIPYALMLWHWDIFSECLDVPLTLSHSPTLVPPTPELQGMDYAAQRPETGQKKMSPLPPYTL